MKNVLGRFVLPFVLLIAGVTLYAAVGDITPAFRRSPINSPVSPVSDWTAVCTDVTVTDNSTATVLNPSSISRSSQNWLEVGGIGTIVQFRLRYKLAITVTTPPVIQPFGRDMHLGGTPLAQRLLDSGGTHQLTLTPDATNDVQDGTYGYTQPVEVDASACQGVIAAVKTAFAASDTTGAQIEARVK